MPVCLKFPSVSLGSAGDNTTGGSIAYLSIAGFCISSTLLFRDFGRNHPKLATTDQRLVTAQPQVQKEVTEHEVQEEVTA